MKLCSLVLLTLVMIGCSPLPAKRSHVWLPPQQEPLERQRTVHRVMPKRFPTPVSPNLPTPETHNAISIAPPPKPKPITPFQKISAMTQKTPTPCPTVLPYESNTGVSSPQFTEADVVRKVSDEKSHSQKEPIIGPPLLEREPVPNPPSLITQVLRQLHTPHQGNAMPTQQSPTEPETTPTPEQRFPLEKAQVAYRAFEYEQCLSILKKQLSTIPTSTPGYVDALAYAGASAFMLGKESKARDYFGRIHSLDPSYRINEEEFSPDIVDLFAR